jgi:hypothetical protein
MTINTIDLYPSFGALTDIATADAYMADGIIAVTLDFGSLLSFEGILRLYRSVQSDTQFNNALALYNISLGNIVEDQYVNSPTETYIFRNLFATDGYSGATTIPGGYRFAYFDISGCIVSSPNELLIPCVQYGCAQSNYFSTGLNPSNPAFQPQSPTPIALGDPTGFLIYPSPSVFADTTGRIYQTWLTPASWWKTSAGYSFNVAERCPFGQVLDMTGRVLTTVMRDNLLIPPPNGGLVFPPSGLSALASAYAYGALSGLVKVVLGVGYCKPTFTINGTIEIPVIDALGVVEGFMAEPVFLDLSDPTGMPTIPGFSASRMYTRLNGVQFNTYMHRTGFPDLFGPGYANVDLTVEPTITISNNGTSQYNNLYSYCPSTNTQGGAVIYYNYTAFEPNVVFYDLYLVRIDITTPNMTEIPIATHPAILLPGFFDDITVPGFYCLKLNTNFVDGYGYRTVLRSCFQIGMLAATTTQLRSFYTNAGVGSPFPQPLPYSGYGANVVTEIYLNVPPILLIPNDGSGWEPRVRIMRFSPDAFDQAQLENYGGTEVPVYDNNLGYLDVQDQYVLLPASSTSKVNAYQNQWGSFNRYVYIQILYNGAAEAITVASMVQMEYVIPIYSPSGADLSPIDYQCDTNAIFHLIAEMRLTNTEVINAPTCPDQTGVVYGNAEGGFCMPVNNPILNGLMNPAPFQSPCTYFYTYSNAQDLNNEIFLYGGQNAYIYPAPTNILLDFTAIDMMGNVAHSFFTVFSRVPPSSTFINILPVQPFCVFNYSTGINGTNTSTPVGNQYVMYQFVIGGITQAIVNFVYNNTNVNITVGPIYGWQPLNMNILGQYNPNSPFFDIPTDCALLQTMTPFEVYELCNNITGDPICDGCTHLPPAFPGADGTTLITNVEGWWEAFAWVPSTEYNPGTNRSIYCRWALSVFVQIPGPMFLIPTNLRRVDINGNPCMGTVNCFAVDIQIFIDPAFNSSYLSMVQLTAAPAFGNGANATSVIPITANSHIVSLNTAYELTLSLDDVFCPVTVTYITNSAGPLIQVARVTHTVCNKPTAVATLYMVYTDPGITTGSTAHVCMFWPDRDKLNPTQTPQFYSFVIGVNLVNPTVLPFPPDFPVTVNTSFFDNVGAGLQTIVVYDRCVDVTDPTCNADCTTLINQNTLQLVNPNLRFQVFQFTVDNLNNLGGGLVISLDNFTSAQCYGDTYMLEFSVYDDIANPDQTYGPYSWQFFEPFTNNLLAQSPACVNNYYTGLSGGQPLITPPPVVGFKVRLFTVSIPIQTGATFGFRDSGNYTFIVTNCQLGCVQTYVVYIDMVNPFDLILSVVDSDCAYVDGAITTSFTGGTPFLPGELADETYYIHDDGTILRTAQYITYWKTPSNPNFVRVRLGSRNPPGNYTVIVVDRNGCNATATAWIKSPDPLFVRLNNISAACSSSTQAKLSFLVGGGFGPPYYTLQNLTTVVPGQNITFEFVTAFGQVVCFNVMDAVGCILPQQVCYSIPQPGPLNLSVAVQPSCPNQATGSATVTLLGTNQSSFSCAWSSTSGVPLSLVSCTQDNLAANTDLIVTVTNIIGCTGTTTVFIPQQPPIIINEIYRSVNGTYGQVPCIDTAAFSVYGGATSPNYTVTLIRDTTGANISYNGNHTILMTGVCRTVQYVIAVTDGNGQCVQTFISVDPQFGFGGDGGNTSNLVYPLGLPPFSNSEFGEFGLVIVYGDDPPPQFVLKERELSTFFVSTLMVYVFLFLMVVISCVGFIAMSMRRSRRLD